MNASLRCIVMFEKKKILVKIYIQRLIVHYSANYNQREKNILLTGNSHKCVHRETICQYKHIGPKVASSSTHILVLVLGNSKSILEADTMAMTLICKNSVRACQSPMSQLYQSFDLRHTVWPFHLEVLNLATVLLKNSWWITLAEEYLNLLKISYQVINI